MSISIAVDDGNDVFLDDDGNLALVSGGDELVQRVGARFKMLRGDSVFYPSAGLPYPSGFVGNSHSPDEIESILKREILSIDEISRLSRFSADFDRSRRVFTVEWAAVADGVTIEGLTNAN